jgi:hypothetical protein
MRCARRTPRYSPAMLKCPTSPNRRAFAPNTIVFRPLFARFLAELSLPGRVRFEPFRSAQRNPRGETAQTAVVRRRLTRTVKLIEFDPKRGGRRVVRFTRGRPPRALVFVGC